MRIELQDEDNLDVPMAPLIDVVFLLLIFFLVASQLKEIKRELKLELPEATAAAEVVVPDDLLIIAIDRAGQAYIGSEPVTTTMLLDEIRQRSAQQPDLRVRIDADRETAYHNVVRVLNELQFHGYTNVGLQVHQEPQR